MKTRRRILFSLAPTLVLFGVLEGAARLAPDSMTASRTDIAGELAEIGVLAASWDVPGWDLGREGSQTALASYTTNRWHMRGPNYEGSNSAETVRVIFVGDSTVYGWQLNWDDTFAARFAQRREAAEPNMSYQVASCACPGHSSFQSIYKLERHCLDFDPDVVVIANQNSDVAFDKQEDKNRFAVFEYPRLARTLETSAFYRLSSTWWRKRTDAVTAEATKIAQLGQTPLGGTHRVSPSDYDANLRSLARVSREAGAVPVFFVLAASCDLQAVPCPGDEYRNIMRQVGEEEDVQVIDAAAYFDQHLQGADLFMDFVHPNADGADVMSALLDRELPLPVAAVHQGAVHQGSAGP